MRENGDRIFLSCQRVNAMNAGMPSEGCGRSRALSQELNDKLPKQASKLPRYSMVACATGYAHELHSGIIRLVESGHFAAATTLIRPLLEATVTAGWALYAAPASQIEDLFHDRSHLPGLGRRLQALESRPELRGKLGLLELMQGAGKIFHKFTHGEMEQLRRRYGIQDSTYSSDENTATLIIADLLLLLCASICAVTTRNPEFEALLKLRSDQFMANIAIRDKKLVEDWPGWVPLPSPIIELGRIPPELLTD